MWEDHVFDYIEIGLFTLLFGLNFWYYYLKRITLLESRRFHMMMFILLQIAFVC